MKSFLLYTTFATTLMVTSCNLNNHQDSGELGGGKNEYSIIASIKSDDEPQLANDTENGGWEISSLTSIDNRRIIVDTDDGSARWAINATTHFLTDSSSDISLFTAIELSEDGETATFKGSHVLDSAPQKLYGIHPATGIYQNNLYTLSPITFQDNSLNQTAMTAYPTTVTVSEGVIAEKIGFTHLYAAIGVKLKLPSDIEGKVAKVSIQKYSEASQNRRIATTVGRQIDIKAEPKTPNFRVLKSQINELEAGITIIMPNDGKEVPLGGTFDIYAKIYPSDLAGTFLNFIVKLADGRQLTVKKEGVDFQRGKYYKFKDGNRPEQLTMQPNIIFSDERFKAFLLNATSPEIAFFDSATTIDIDNDGDISAEEARNVSAIRCPNMQLTSIEGVEYFTNLIELNCSNNAIANVDISKLDNLLNFDCSSNSSSFFALLHNSSQKGYIDNSTTRPTGWNWNCNNPTTYIQIEGSKQTGQHPLTARVNVQTQTATPADIIDNKWVGVGINRDYAIQHDYSLPFNGKPSYRFELKDNDNSLEGVNDGDTKGRAEVSYCYATDNDFIGEPADTYEKAQIVKTVYHYGKGMSAQGASMKYQFSFYAPSTLSADVHSIFAQWHGAPTRTLAQNPEGDVIQLTVDEFIEMSKTMGFKKDVGYDKIGDGDKLSKEPNGWLIEQGGYPPLAFGLANGVFYIKVNSDKKWLSDKKDRTNANSADREVMKPLKSEFKESTIAYRMAFADFPKDRWITFNIEIDWTKYSKEQQTILKPGRLDVTMAYELNGVRLIEHIVNSEEVMIGRNDEDGYYFKFGIYRTGNSLVPVWYNLAGYCEAIL